MTYIGIYRLVEPGLVGPRSMGSNYQIELIELIDFPGLMNPTWSVTRDGIVGIFVKTLATDGGSRALDGLSSLLYRLIRLTEPTFGILLPRVTFKAVSDDESTFTSHSLPLNTTETKD